MNLESMPVRNYTATSTGDSQYPDYVKNSQKSLSNQYLNSLPERGSTATSTGDDADIARLKEMAPMKRGGKAKHPDVKEDKALIRKMVKPSARTGKADGGKFDSPTHSFKMKLSNGENTTTHNISMLGNSAADALVNAVKFANKGGWNVDNVEHTGSSAGAGSSAGLMNRGGRTKRDEHCWGGEAKPKKAKGGEAGRDLYVRKGYPHEVPGADGGRTAKKGGGSLGKKKGTTNIHVNVMPHGGSGQPPVMPLPIPVPPRPPMAPPMPPQGMPMGAPMGGAPEMPPMGAGRPGMPPMGRKHGGKIPAGMKTMHVIDNAAGGGLGRLEKIKEYGLK
jgi:hypothetical protein